MGAAAAMEAARERMVREAASGRGRRGRQHFTALRGQRHLLAVAAATRAMVDMTTAPTAKTAAAKRVVVSPITPATIRGAGEVSMCPRARIPYPQTPLTRLTLPYLWVRAGIIAIPARVYYLSMLMGVFIRSAAPAEVARRPGAKA